MQEQDCIHERTIPYVDFILFGIKAKSKISNSGKTVVGWNQFQDILEDSQGFLPKKSFLYLEMETLAIIEKFTYIKYSLIFSSSMKQEL